MGIRIKTEEARDKMQDFFLGLEDFGLMDLKNYSSSPVRDDVSVAMMS